MASSDSLGVGLGLLRFNTTSTMDGSSGFQREIKAGWKHNKHALYHLNVSIGFLMFLLVNVWIGATGTYQDSSSSASI